MFQNKNFKRLKQKLPKHFITAIIINVTLITFQIFYLVKRISYLSSEIPLWYTKPWGLAQLAQKTDIWMIPIVTTFVVIGGLLISLYAKNKYMRYADETYLFLTSIYNFILTYSLIRIIKISSIPFDPLVSPLVLELVIPFVLASLLVYIIAPKFISFAHDYGIVTSPKHIHPAMILREPSARGGGLLVALVFILLTVLLVPLTKVIIGLIVAVLVLSITGIADDIQNTNPFSKLKFMENPALRLVLQAIATCIVIYAGVRINFINNPFDGFLFLNEFTLNIGGTEFAPLALLITFVWILWIINMLSWSNGVDGQYSGIVTITALVIGIVALRNLIADPNQLHISKMAIILAGASIGLLPFNWHPSKIMWGFSATSAGIIIATLSLLTQAKVSVSILALLIPFLDAGVTVVRRLLQKKSPLRGDRGHLHHLLMERGWGVKQIAVFYWASAALLGLIAVAATDRAVPLVVLTVGGLVLFPIVLLNFASFKEKPVIQSDAIQEL